MFNLGRPTTRPSHPKAGIIMNLSLLIETEMESEELIKVRKCTTLLDKKEDKKRESKVKKQKFIAKVFWNNLKV